MVVLFCTCLILFSMINRTHFNDVAQSDPLTSRNQVGGIIFKNDLVDTPAEKSGRMNGVGIGIGGHDFKRIVSGSCRTAILIRTIPVQGMIASRQILAFKRFYEFPVWS